MSILRTHFQSNLLIDVIPGTGDHEDTSTRVPGRIELSRRIIGGINYRYSLL